MKFRVNGDTTVECLIIKITRHIGVDGEFSITVKGKIWQGKTVLISSLMGIDCEVFDCELNKKV